LGGWDPRVIVAASARNDNHVIIKAMCGRFQELSAPPFRRATE
jgi:hypothetical protein